MAKTEVRTELKLDDLASTTLSKIKSGFVGLEKSVTGVQNRVVAFASQTAAMAIGVNLGNIIVGIRGLAMGAVNAAMEGQEQMRSLTKTVAGMSKERGVGMDTFTKRANEAYETLRKISSEAGVSRAELVSTFSEVGANTVKTDKQLLDLIGNVSKAARALPAPVSEVVKGFAEIEKNTISASNPLIEMVKQANLMRGHNEQIALRLQFMGRQGMLQLMNKALKEMQERAKKMPMTLKDMGTMLHDMHTDVMKIIGEPMVRAISPAFQNLYEKIVSNRGAIEKYAKVVGEKAGEWITEAAKKIEEGFKYVQTHAEEIKQAIVEAFEFAKSVIEFAIKHKEALAIGALGAKAAPTAIEGAKGLAEFSRSLISVARGGIPQLGIAASQAAQGLGGAALTLGAFALAVAAVGAAFWQLQKYLEENKGHLLPGAGEAHKNVDARMEYFEGIAKDFRAMDKTGAEGFDRIRAAAIREAEAAGMNTRAVGERIDALYREHNALVNATRGIQTAESMFKAIPADTSQLNDEQMAQAAQTEADATKMFMLNFADAMATGNKQAQEAAALVIIGNKKMQTAMLSSGMDISKGLMDLADIIGDRSKEFVQKVKDRSEGEATASKGTGPVPTNVFNGGQTFNIKQDFRDQDPDRIAVIFQRDIVRAAESRLMARTAMFGGG